MFTATSKAADDVDVSPQPPSSEGNNSRSDSGGRIEWIDYARGLNIIMVVMGHAVKDAVMHPSIEAGGVFEAALNGGVWAPVYYNFRMPFFFLLSGMFIERTVSRNGREFLHDRAATLVYPYLLWSAIQIAFPLLFSGLIRPRRSAGDLLWLWAAPVMHFWFIYALIFVSSAYWLARKAGGRPAAIALVGCVLYLVRDRVWLASWPASQDILLYFPFYALGAVASLHAPRVRISSAPLLAAITACGLGTCIACARLDWNPSPIVQLAVTLVGISGAVALSALIARVPFMAFLKPLGNRSLEIYVAHWFGISIARNVLLLGFKVADVNVHTIVATVAGIAGPMALGSICRRIGLKYVYHLPKPQRPLGRSMQPAPWRGARLVPPVDGRRALEPGV